ncbi:angiotensin-converting enzyme [Diaphorina citri]|uniref:Angiotensin-converting enzyme n=1 Tax=Diaphorina citri TaxID=121845 RepID=A0A1S3D9R4_DIACI|nr:angiotensin-converting enzyme [Diaphorina citri]
MMGVLLMVGLLVTLSSCLDPQQDTDGEVEARQFIDFLNRKTGHYLNDGYKAEWAYATNITDHNLEVKMNKSAEHAQFTKDQWKELIKYPWQTYSNQDLRRQYKMYSILGSAALPYEKFQKRIKVNILGEIGSENIDQWQETAQDTNVSSYNLLLFKYYTRRRLNEKYGDKVVNRRGPIPAHLLGNMWAQTWGNIYDIVVPYPEKTPPDVSAELVRQGYTVHKMFRTAEEFFTSINMSAMPPEFWERSMLEKPQGREVVCHASAWDFHDGKDFRIKMCTRVNEEDLFTIHHEMGHVEYFIQYKDQPMAFREGANPAMNNENNITITFVAKVINRKFGIRTKINSDKTIFMVEAIFLFKIDTFLINTFVNIMMDLWRWGVFKKDISHEEYNKHWWKLRHDYQGVEPPTHRSEDDFDPGAKYHIVASVPYIRYFVSFVIQFQFHRALCEKAGEFDPNDPSKQPLHECDIYRSTEAGNLLKNMLAMGSSKPWPDAMEAITGQREMDASALLQYFEPLYKWLEEENARTGEHIGWEATDKKVFRSDAEKSRYMEEHEAYLRETTTLEPLL